MKEEVKSGNSRRQFITKSVPACALTCLLGKEVFALTKSISTLDQQESGHKFDQNYDKQLTFREFMRTRYGEAISLMKSLEKEMGKEKAIEFLKKTTTENWLKRGIAQSDRSPDNSLNTYVEQFRGGYENTLTKEVVEDSEKAFELKVTECIWASTFLEANMGEFGYAWVCWGDYAWTRGFNPKIKLVGDKTLMQGHDYCNHRYIWNV